MISLIELKSETYWLSQGLANPRDTVSLSESSIHRLGVLEIKTIEALERYGLREGVGLMGAIFAYNLNTELKSKAKAAVKEFIELLRKR